MEIILLNVDFLQVGWLWVDSEHRLSLISHTSLDTWAG